ncbi:hypothetical protein HUJ05_008216 [Dendroctonus ponderosae]|nr:hypothetical protein HUJ05_008216 [Dendroctonus ponderosae]
MKQFMPEPKAPRYVSIKTLQLDGSYEISEKNGPTRSGGNIKRPEKSSNLCDNQKINCRKNEPKKRSRGASERMSPQGYSLKGALPDAPSQITTG